MWAITRKLAEMKASKTTKSTKVAKKTKSTKAVEAKSPNKVYVAVTAVVTAVFLFAGIATSLATYPTHKHRDVAHHQQELIDKNGGWLNTAATQETKEYKELANTKEGKHIASTDSSSSLIQLALYVFLLFAVYVYIRWNNISPTGRTIGATAFIVTLGSFLSAQLLQVLSSFSIIMAPSQPDFGAWLIPATAFLFLVTMIVNFFFVWLFEVFYNGTVRSNK